MKLISLEFPDISRSSLSFLHKSEEMIVDRMKYMHMLN